MAVAAWPETLPFRPDSNGWTNSLGAAPLRTDIEGPAPEQRSRPGDDIETVRWERSLTHAQFAALRSFVTGTLRNGAARFYMPVTLNRTDYEIRAVKIEAGSFTAVGIDNARVRVSMSLQVFPGVWAPAAPAITGVSGATISGTAADGATVQVDIGGSILTVVATGGVWSVQPLLVAGTYAVRISGAWNGFTWPWSAHQNVTLGLQAATSALIARMTVAPGSTRAALINGLVIDLTAAGLWSKLDALYLLAAHDAQAARLNWIGASYTLTAVNSPVFTTDRGYAGAGGAVYLATGFDPAAASGAKYLQNSAHISAWSLSNFQQTGGLIGNGVANGDAHIYPWPADNRLYTQVNSASSDSIVLAASSGHFIASRVTATAHKAYRDGSLVATYTRASTAPASHAFVIGAGGPGTGYTTRQIAAATIGAGLTDAEAASLRSILRAYLLALGAVA